MSNFDEIRSLLALVAHRQIHSDAGGATVFCVVLADGFIVDCGSDGYSEKRATLSMSPKEFREALVKPGYDWTVHKTPKGFTYLEATGIKSSGFNRLSTLSVIRRENGTFEAKSAGYGTRAKWLHVYTDSTLARALRGLQDYYEYMANTYGGHASAIRNARKASTAVDEAAA